MTHLTHTPAGNPHTATDFPPQKPIGNDISKLPFRDGIRPSGLPADTHGTAEERRAFFKIAEQRELVTFGPDVSIQLLTRFIVTKTYSRSGSHHCRFLLQLPPLQP